MPVGQFPRVRDPRDPTGLSREEGAGVIGRFHATGKISPHNTRLTIPTGIVRTRKHSEASRLFAAFPLAFSAVVARGPFPFLRRGQPVVAPNQEFEPLANEPSEGVERRGGREGETKRENEWP